ncbi:MAG: Dienelactone hydrolase family protein [candidate division TM6 bacterium GW2011_GWE2_36_25]|nr:MAG: Dienelactone hydrolase family protein [candidate division TM6 bacterium GW2011_GWF2_36_131]KKQ03575.1 MAG: Dienelactone hydrolase family protein [candidate division TM6 bacterium GW2011_GWE2_36_25]KKQ20149.1 MAG: Dienelactone hydrolase family protein [candidate division TM6 bacterium GW2011_GWA2_36_9]
MFISKKGRKMIKKGITIPLQNINLYGNLNIPDSANGLVIFVHGSGSSRFSPRNNFVADVINKAGLATLLFDLLTEQEDIIDEQTRQFRFDIPLLAKRLIEVSYWITQQENLKHLNLGYFGSSTGAAAALIGAAELPQLIKAVVSRGGRTDLADTFLPRVKAATLCIVGALDDVVIQMNQESLAQINAKKELIIIPGATHLFEEPGTLEKVANEATQWFINYLS